MRLSRGLTPSQVYSAFAVALVVIIVVCYPVRPADFWWHLAWGRSIAAHGPWVSPPEIGFTHPEGPFFDQPWLAQLAMYGLFRAGGPELMLVVQAVLLGATYWLLLELMGRRANGHARACALLFVAFVIPLSANNWELRPQSFAYLLFVIVLRFVTARRLGWAAKPWTLIPVFVSWANLHGSFVLGLGLLAIAVVVEGVRTARTRWGKPPYDALSVREWSRLAGWSVAALVSTALNPHGLVVFVYAVRVPRLLAAWNVCIEWNSPSPKTFWGAIFSLGMLGVFVLVARAKKRIDATDLVTLVVFLWSALTATRSVIWFAFVAAPVAAEALGSLLTPHDTEEEPSLGGVAVVALLGALAMLVPVLRHRASAGFSYMATPVAAVEYLRKLGPDTRPRRLFHDEGTGSYLLYVAPEQPVFIDPRFEFYPEAQWRDVQRLNAGADEASLLAKYQVDGVLLRTATQQGLVDRVAADPSWKQVYRDDDAVLFLPASSPRVPRDG